MVAWSALLLPALLSGLAVFALSSLIHMVLRWHAPEYRGFSNEDEVRAAINRGNPRPGQYVLPYGKDMAAMGTPEMQARYAEGPVGQLFLRPKGAPAMGASLGTWFAYSLLTGLIAGYVARASLPAAAEFPRVLQVVGAAAWLGYAWGEPTASIWKGQSWSSTARYLLDGLLYALATGAIFAALWPGA
jgi:hypothetical protein